MRKFVLMHLLIAILVNSACSYQDRKNTTHNSQLLALGTLINISLWDVDENLADSVVHAVDNRLQTFHHDWQGWAPGRLADINAALASGMSITLKDDELKLLQQAISLSQSSQGLFNPAIGQLIGLWGFHSDNPAGPPPNDAAIKTLLHLNPSMSDLRLDDHELSSQNKAVQLDLGAFAKGYAIDQAVMIIKQNGIKNAIINAGGDLRAIGAHGNRPWHIGVRHPTKAGTIAAIDTQGDESIFTSGNYERFYVYEGQRYQHIIDPRTGYPSTGTLSVTVIHQDAATADAAATAIMIAGTENWQTVAHQMNIDKVMLVDEQLTVHLTPAMLKRIKFEHQPTIVLSNHSS